MERRRRISRITALTGAVAGLVLGTLGALTVSTTLAGPAAAAVNPYRPTTLAASGATGPVVLSDDAALVAIAEGSAVEVRRTGDESLLATLPVGGAAVTSLDFASPTSILVGTDNGVLYLSWTVAGTVVTPRAALTVPNAPAAASVVAAGATKAYVLDADGDIWLTDVTGADTTRWRADELVLPDRYEAIAYGANRLYAITDTTVQEIKAATSTGEMLRRLTLNAPARSLAISPDGARLFIGETGQLAQLATASWAQPTTTTLPAPVNTAYPPAPTTWSPVGQWDSLPTLAGTANSSTVSCNALGVATDGTTVYCADDAAGGDLFWFNANGATLAFGGVYDTDVAAAPGMTQPVAATTSRVYAALDDGSVTSVPVASILAPEAVPVGSRPSAPVNVVVSSAATTTLDVSWTAPVANGGQKILGYLVTALRDDNTPFYCKPGTSGTACTITGLDKSTLHTYSVSVEAANIFGPGSPSDPQTVTPGIPTAPRNVTLGTPRLVGAKASLPVSWSLPSSSGETAIRGYFVCADVVPDTGAQTTCARTTLPLPSTCAPNGTFLACGSASATTATLTGLDPAKTYLVTVTAFNETSAGIVAGPYPIVPGAPSAPTNLTATVQNQTITLSWRPPTYSGIKITTGTQGGVVAGTPTVAYTAWLVTGAGSRTPCQGSLSAAMATTTCTWTGLTNGTTYSAEVYAWANASSTSAGGTTTIKGQMSPAATVFDLLPATTPRAPKVTGVSTAPGAVTVTWEAPDDDGGSPITGYTASARAGGVARTCSTTTQLVCTITGLTNGVGYGVTVVATNAQGAGPQTAGVVARPAGPSTSVRAVTVSATGTNATVEWDAPAAIGAESVKGYAVTAVSVHGTRTCSTTELLCRLSGLVAGDAYAVSVTATNSAGYVSTATAPVTFTALTTPAAPTASVAQLRKKRKLTHKGNVTVRWNGVAGATGYQVTRTGGPLLRLTREVSGTGRDSVFLKLPKGRYAFTVVALAPGSHSLSSAAVTVRVK